MPVVLLIVGLVILVAVVYAAMGRGGELSAEHTDYAPLDLGPVSATDVVLLRPPSAAWGYDMRTTDEALERIAESIRERDVRIVALEQLVTDLGRPAPALAPLGSPFPNARPAPVAEPPTVVDAPVAEPPTVVEPPARAAAPIAPESLAAAPVPDPAPDPDAAPVGEQAQRPEQPQLQRQPQPLPQRLPQRQQPPPERSHD